MACEKMRAWFVVTPWHDTTVDYLAGPLQDEDVGLATLEALREQMEDALAARGLPDELRVMFLDYRKRLAEASVVQLELEATLVEKKLVVTP